MKDFKSKRGLATVITTIVVVVAIIVSLIIYAQLSTVANSFNMGTAGNATRTSTFNTVYNATNLMVVLIVILAAAAVLGGIRMLRG